VRKEGKKKKGNYSWKKRGINLLGVQDGGSERLASKKENGR